MNERCEFCDRPAQWRFTEVVAGHKHTVHVCPDCAGSRGIVGGAVLDPEDSGTDASDPFEPISLPVTPEVRASRVPTAPRRCSQCGTTLVAIRKSGRVGCPHCYSTFRRHLEPLLRRVHGALEHRGHRPDGGAVGGDDGYRERLEQLREQLRRAIEGEDFESAARLRDEIAKARTLRMERGS